MDLSHPFQIGIVVRDLDAAIARHDAVIGAGEWLVVENGPQNLHGLHVRGEPREFSMRLALRGSNPQLELLQPVDGDDILRDWLDRHGEGLHHLGVLVESVDDTIAAMQARGIACVQHGYGFGADGSGAFAYFDTEAELGYLIEAIEPANDSGS
jgi:catechol 2,3-dioxygenase-like lactoylglutathione lyase family enzyme